MDTTYKDLDTSILIRVFLMLIFQYNKQLSTSKLNYQLIIINKLASRPTWYTHDITSLIIQANLCTFHALQIINSSTTRYLWYMLSITLRCTLS